MIKAFITSLFLLNQVFYQVPVEADIVETLSNLFRSGNSKEISKNFAPSVEFSLNNEEDTFSKAQAEQILRDFFIKNTPVNSAVVHLINTNPNYRFGILLLTTKNGRFRVAITLKKSLNTFIITELKIEPDK